MRTCLLITAVAGLLVIPALTPAASAAPQPSIAPKSWQLNFDFEDPQRLVVQFPGEDQPRVYWYMLYSVTNNSNRDVQFMPQFEVVTENLKVYPANPAADPAVFDIIKRLHLRDRPFLLEPFEAMGKLLQGADNAKDSVAVWRDFTGEARRFSVFVGGLSGETAVLPNPAYDPDKPKTEVKTLPDGEETEVVVNPRKFVLHKTLQVDYRLPGDQQTRSQAAPVREKVEWIMR